MTVASRQCDGLRVVAPDGCTVGDSTTLQGFWTEAQYLALTNRSNRLLEFTDGHIEVLPIPTRQHQAISRFLFLALYFFVRGIGGNVFYAPLRLHLRKGKFREPDLLLVTDAEDARCRNDYWLGADLVVEVVSPDNPTRDLIDKRKDYTEAGIPEYWIANPVTGTLTMLVLSGDEFREHGVFQPGEQAGSLILPGFSVDVRELFDAA